MSLLIQSAQVLGAARDATPSAPSFDLGAGQAPPNSQGILTGLKWIFYIVSAIAVAGALGLGGRMLWSAIKDGHGGGHVDNMGWYLMGCLIIGSASGIPALLM